MTDRLFADCCYGTDQQHLPSDPCPQEWECFYELPEASLKRLLAERAELYDAASALISDVRRRHPGEELRCEYMRALDAALVKARAAQ